MSQQTVSPSFVTAQKVARLEVENAELREEKRQLLHRLKAAESALLEAQRIIQALTHGEAA